MIKKILLFLLLVLIVIQFIHPAKNSNPGTQPNFIGNKFPVPEPVSKILKKACYDCHSNNTEYPWYSKIQPMHWWLEKHIREGKKHLNYDEYTNRSLYYQFHKMEETVEMVEEKEMPLNSYTWIHKDAKLDSSERSALINWAHAVMDNMKSIYPADSLVRKK